MKKRKKKFLEPKIGNRRIKLTRILPAAALSIAMLTGSNGVFEKETSSTELAFGKKQIHTEYKDLDSVLSPELDEVLKSVYKVNEEITLYVQQNKVMKPIQTIYPEQEINVFNTKTEIDSVNMEYLYCELDSQSTIGLIKKEDLSKGIKKEDKSVGFDSIYQITNLSSMGTYMQATIGKDGVAGGEKLEYGEIIFVDEKDIQLDDDGNYWLKARTNNGSIGYIKNDDKVKEINDGVLVEVVSSADAKGMQYQILNKDVPNLITNVPVGSRLVVIGQGSKENLSKVIYYDLSGSAKWGEIEKEFIQEVVLVASAERLAPDLSYKEVKTENMSQNVDITRNENITQNEVKNDVDAMNKNLSKWYYDYKNGSYGVDISRVTSEVQKKFLEDDGDKMDFAIVRVGVTGWGCNRGKLVLVEDGTVSTDDYMNNLVQGQINLFEEYDIPVMAYFYGTDINTDEALLIAQYIEDCIDSLDSKIPLQPIVDCEICEFPEDDRMVFVNKPNYDEFYEKTGINIDFEYLKKLPRGEWPKYVESNSDVLQYVEFCQDKKAQAIASIYKKLYDDGYIKGKNALLYSGNQAISKDESIVTITHQNGILFSAVPLVKYDDVVEYLTNSDSPYYIAEDFSLKVWYADYSGKENYKILDENDVAITQFGGDVKIEEIIAFDKNYGCTEYIESMFEAARQSIKNDTEKSEKNDDELDLG